MHDRLLLLLLGLVDKHSTAHGGIYQHQSGQSSLHTKTVRNCNWLMINHSCKMSCNMEKYMYRGSGYGPSQIWSSGTQRIETGLFDRILPWSPYPIQNADYLRYLRVKIRTCACCEVNLYCCLAGLLILQYCIGIGSTVYWQYFFQYCKSIAMHFENWYWYSYCQYFFLNIGNLFIPIPIVNTFFAHPIAKFMHLRTPIKPKLNQFTALGSQCYVF